MLIIFNKNFTAKRRECDNALRKRLFTTSQTFA